VADKRFRSGTSSAGGAAGCGITTRETGGDRRDSVTTTAPSRKASTFPAGLIAVAEPGRIHPGRECPTGGSIPDESVWMEDPGYPAARSVLEAIGHETAARGLEFGLFGLCTCDCWQTSAARPVVIGYPSLGSRTDRAN
jgi:hypothetical protein